ncbi:hypothetical protein ACF063_41880 [Streptomyces chartreusis]|uniref:hypothetical protein n=1 Tax=Streptomyces chartreusis TaxID=1969 RepID=UPI003702B971
MRGERKVWVGYQVHDGIADREGIITGVKGGMYVLRPVFTGGHLDRARRQGAVPHPLARGAAQAAPGGGVTEFPKPVPADRMGVLWAMYQYRLVCCFRCPRKGTQVTRIGDNVVRARRAACAGPGG